MPEHSVTTGHTMPRVARPTSWDDDTGRAIYAAIEAGHDPSDLPLPQAAVSWHLIWMVHLGQIVICREGSTVPFRPWDEHVDGDQLAA